MAQAAGWTFPCPVCAMTAGMRKKAACLSAFRESMQMGMISLTMLYRAAPLRLLPKPRCPPALPMGFVRVRDSRAALAAISANFYDHPASRLDLIGITGTNGKTTTSLLIESILRSHGSSPGVLGTLAYRWAGKQIPAPMTTPESLDLQRLFYRMLQDGVSHVVMEVSSHALALGRVAGCEFRTGVFTNLSQDHLDFHSTMEEYFAAKKLLFSSYLDPHLSAAVVNEDDDYGRRIIENGTSRSQDHPLLRQSLPRPPVWKREQMAFSSKKSGSVPGASPRKSTHLKGKSGLIPLSWAG